MRIPQLYTKSLLQILSTDTSTKRFLLALLMLAMMIVGISMPPIGSSVGRAEECSSKNVGSVPRKLTGRPNNNKGLEGNWVSTRLSKRVAAAIPSPTPPVGCCGDDEYKTNNLAAGIGPTTVSSTRAGNTQIKNYP